VGTYNSSEVSPGRTNTYSPGDRLSNSAIPTPTGTILSELGSTQHSYPPTELGNTQAPQGQQQPGYIANDYSSQTISGQHEMSGTGGIVRKPVRQSAGMDMSGNPTTENYPHELA